MTLYYLYFSDVHYVCYVFLQQEHIYKLMKSDSYSRFIRSSAYQELLQAKKKVKKTNIFWCKLWKNAWQGSACLKVKFYLFTLRLFTVGDVETCPAGTRSHTFTFTFKRAWMEILLQVHSPVFSLIQLKGHSLHSFTSRVYIFESDIIMISDANMLANNRQFSTTVAPNCLCLF